MLRSLLVVAICVGVNHLAVFALTPVGPNCDDAVKKAPLLYPFLRDLPAPPTDALCSWVLKDFCTRLSVVEWGLSRAGPNGGSCNNTQLPLTAQMTPFEDERPLPSMFTDPTAIMAAEGPTYYWLWTVILNLYTITPCGPGVPLLAPEGWVVRTLFDDSQGPNRPSLVFGAILLQPATQQLAVVLRGTMTEYEWDENFTYNQTFAPTFNSPVHTGFNNVFQEIWPAIQTQIKWLVPSAAKQVFVAGHSLGAAVATLLAYAIQSDLNARLGAAAPLVSTALFAPPNVGPPGFVEQFNQVVNGRRIAFQYDVVPQAPCTPEQPACSASSLPLGVRAIDPLRKALMPTNMPGNVSSWNYTQVGGWLQVLASYMPQDAASWAGLAELQFCWAAAFADASHICSYGCFTSQYAPAGSAAPSNCWLSPKPAGAAGTACSASDWDGSYPGMAGAEPASLHVEL